MFSFILLSTFKKTFKIYLSFTWKEKSLALTVKRIEESLGPNNINIYKALSAIFWHLTSFLISDPETRGSQLPVFMSFVYGKRFSRTGEYTTTWDMTTGRRLKQAKGTGRQERGRESNRGGGQMKCHLLLRKSVFFRDVAFDRLPLLWWMARYPCICWGHYVDSVG